MSHRGRNEGCEEVYAFTQLTYRVCAYALNVSAPVKGDWLKVVQESYILANIVILYTIDKKVIMQYNYIIGVLYNNEFFS